MCPLAKVAFTLMASLHLVTGEFVPKRQLLYVFLNLNYLHLITAKKVTQIMQIECLCTKTLIQPTNLVLFHLFCLKFAPFFVSWSYNVHKRNTVQGNKHQKTNNEIFQVRIKETNIQ